MIAGASPVDCHKQDKQAQGPTPNVQQAESEDTVWKGHSINQLVVSFGG